MRALRDTKRASKISPIVSAKVQGILRPMNQRLGMLLALQDINKADKVIFIGFDANSLYRRHAQSVEWIVMQDPVNMGYLGVRTMVEQLLGKPVEKRIDTGVTMVTRENLDSADIQTLLHPPLDQYLK